MREQFKVGDVVTWGSRVIAHRVIEVTSEGVVVDSSVTGFGELQDDGSRTILVYFEPVHWSPHHTPEHTDTPADTGRAARFPRPS